MEDLQEINELIKEAEEKLSEFDKMRQEGKVLNVIEAMTYSNYLMSLAVLDESKQLILSQQN